MVGEALNLKDIYDSHRQAASGMDSCSDCRRRCVGPIARGGVPGLWPLEGPAWVGCVLCRSAYLYIDMPRCIICIRPMAYRYGWIGHKPSSGLSDRVPWVLDQNHGEREGGGGGGREPSNELAAGRSVYNICSMQPLHPTASLSLHALLLCLTAESEENRRATRRQWLGGGSKAGVLM
jgi:hypothetical protein